MPPFESSVFAGQTVSGQQGALAAVLWDMDGTLVDTEPFWLDAEIDLVTRAGGVWDPAVLTELVGQPLLSSAEVLRTRFGLSDAPDRIVDHLLAAVTTRLQTEAIPWRPGAQQLLTAVGEAGIPQALVTMSWASMVDVVLAHLPGDAFGAVVTGDAVTHGKPHPEPYLTGARRLGVDIADCVALEDSAPGVGSAEAAGAATVFVQAHITLPPAPGRSRLPSLVGVDVPLLNRIVGGEAVDLLADSDGG